MPRSQSTTVCSSSVEAGALRQNMTFELSPAASHSPRIPAPEAIDGKYPMNPGCCQCVMLGSISRA